jgi:hypothetical protein
MSSISEYEYEAVNGLPGILPEGEKLLWQGAPNWLAFLIHALHARWIVAYFGVLMVWRFVASIGDGGGLQAALVSAAWVLPLTTIVLTLLAGFSFAVARTTVYSITSHRVVFRFGVAVPMAVNIPYTRIASAGLRTYGNGTGDIPLKIGGKDRFAIMVLWPHARGSKINDPEPMFRAVPDAEKVAALLAGALVASQSVAPAAEMPAELAAATPVASRPLRPLVPVAA